MLLFFKNRLLPDNGKPWYVVDTNVLIDCINIIPNGDNEHPQKPTIDLDNANIIIPEVVLDEMDRIVHDDKKPAELKIVVKELLRRIRKILDEDYKPTPSCSSWILLMKPQETADASISCRCTKTLFRACQSSSTRTTRMAIFWQQLLPQNLRFMVSAQMEKRGLRKLKKS